MNKHLVRFSFLIVAAAWQLLTACSSQGAIAHWSFDAATIASGANGITAANDQTGNHNATTVYAGTGGTGAGPQINSVAGQFGEGAEFTNANVNGQAQANRAWMMFPQLTQIAGASGGSFTVAAWAKIPDQSTAWDPVTILGDWGNAPANIPGPPPQGRFSYWFLLNNADTGNPSIRPRGQLRSFNGGAGGGNGGDMIATTLSAAQAGQASFDDGLWHHYAWVWDKPNYRMTFFVDGVQRHVQNGVAANLDHDLYPSASSFGALGAKNDNNRYFTGVMDEVWVFGKAINAAEVLLLKEQNANVPEPSTALLATISLLGLTARRQRHK
jgi:hypothetical protein